MPKGLKPLSEEFALKVSDYLKISTYTALKRSFDFSAAAFGAVLACPVILGAMAVIHLNSPEDPAIFRQTRVGFRGKEFTMYKLRTMTNEKDAEGNLLPDEIRMKSWGKAIRKLSIDELPQIINILRHEMSWIGPRPLLPHEMAVMTPEEQEERQSVLPGITGWEAVNEKYSDSRRRMAEFDLEYVRNRSLRFDIDILIKTALMIIGADRASDEFRAPKLKQEEIKRNAVGIE